MSPLATLVLSCLALFPHDAREHVGIVAADAAGNLICANQSEGDAEHARFSLAPPAGYQLVAMFHTHLSFKYADYFSPADVSLADRYHVPSFILVAGDRFRVYVPGQTKMVPQSHLPPELLGFKVSLGDLPQ